MARIQILQLPPYGLNGESPFALIVDQCATPPQRVIGMPADPPPLPFGHSRPYEVPPVEITDAWGKFGKEIGARSVLVTDETVEIVDGTSDGDVQLEFDHAALAESFATALRFHLESPEASDALRAWYERRRAAAGEQPPQANHYHFTGSALDAARLEAFMKRRDERQGGGSL